MDSTKFGPRRYRVALYTHAVHRKISVLLCCCQIYGNKAFMLHVARYISHITATLLPPSPSLSPLGVRSSASPPLRFPPPRRGERRPRCQSSITFFRPPRTVPHRPSSRAGRPPTRPSPSTCASSRRSPNRRPSANMTRNTAQIKPPAPVMFTPASRRRSAERCARPLCRDENLHCMKRNWRRNLK